MWPAGAMYFALVFGAGFILGIVRALWLAPLVGERTAELVEMPAMVAVLYFAADGVVRRFELPGVARVRLGTGCIAVALLLAAEFVLVLPLRSLSPAEYLAARDPVAGAAYGASLALMAALPVFVRRR